MSQDPRAALTQLVTAFERHLEASARRRSENDPTVVAAYQALGDAFEDYEDALMETYGEVTPLELYAGDDDDFDDDEDEDEDEDEEDDDELSDEADDDELDLEDDDDDEPYNGLADDDVEIERTPRR